MQENITPEIKSKFAKEVQHSLEVSYSLIETYIIAVAINKDRGKNFINRISCSKGLPIGGYIYDAQNDNYHFECTDYLHLGCIPISFMMKVKGIPAWEIRVPIPENVIKKNLNLIQKKDLKNFRNHFQPEIYDISYIQMVNPN